MREGVKIQLVGNLASAAGPVGVSHAEEYAHVRTPNLDLPSRPEYAILTPQHEKVEHAFKRRNQTARRCGGGALAVADRPVPM